MFSVRQNIWTIASKGVTPLLLVKPGWVTPLSRRSLEKFLRANGYAEQQVRGRGSHRMYVKDGSRPVVLPDSDDLSHVVLRNTAHALGLKNVIDLRNSLKG
jgi:predicted RNA binding protein YcfA (HicA-like mRNA interferase family)